MYDGKQQEKILNTSIRTGKGVGEALE